MQISKKSAVACVEWLIDRWPATLLIVLPFIILATHTLVADVCISAGFSCQSVFFGGPVDRFADLIKLSMAFIPPVQIYEFTKNVPDWDWLFIQYLFDNPYIKTASRFTITRR